MPTKKIKPAICRHAKYKRPKYHEDILAKIAEDYPVGSKEYAALQAGIRSLKAWKHVKSEIRAILNAIPCTRRDYENGRSDAYECSLDIINEIQAKEVDLER